MSDLVGNPDPEDRFSQNEAQIKIIKAAIIISLFLSDPLMSGVMEKKHLLFTHKESKVQMRWTAT